LEAGLGWITKFAKDFIGRNKLEQQKINGIQKKLVGMEILEKGIPRHNYEIKNSQGATIGHVTSGTQSPSLNKPIAMGYVDIFNSKIDTQVFIKVRDKLLATKVVKMPFD
jgi:aminomethyltransferase